ncbi:outer membrane channel protein TolC [Alishewanella jeotgali]|uniref:Outer membrane channel protein n=1 Tax=Alishewanella jeotgali KCTC 22429 TaxID=1129374 RepID=H3ZG89_9ALTE|nr:outer membrane channel protein TolC [Alishewanella jeotgali]EHR40409.1 outer membrane channel protein [Alishewanella jeotgali KCTC 22429]
MKKTLLSTLVLSSLSFFSLQLSAEDLQAVYQLATQKDPVVQRAAASRDAATARIDVSRSRLLPSVNFGADVTRSSRDNLRFSGNNTVGAGIQARQSLFDWSNWQGLSRAEKVALQSQTVYNAEVQALIVRVTSAYFDVLRARDNLTFVEAEKRSVERQLEQTKQRFAVGLTAITDVHEAQAQFDSVVARGISSENALENAREALREITGQYHAEIAQLNTDKFSASRPSPEMVSEWMSIAEQNNLTLQAQRIALDVSSLDIELAKAGHLPTLDATANLGVSKTSGFDRADSSSVGINLSVPIYAGGGIEAGVRVAQANYVEVSQALEQSHRSVVRQVRSSFNNVNSQMSVIRALEQAVISAQSALQATEAGFEVGTRTIVDVLLSTRNLFDAQRNLAGARYDYILAQLQLKQAAGNLTEQDLLAINAALTN